MSPLEAGQRFGAYRIIRQLDAGGMGQVYEAEHVNLGARCALKVFSTASSQREFLRKRFLVEGRILAEFRHPGIVRVTDLAVDEDSGAPYFAMDLVVSPSGEPCNLEQARRSGAVSEAQVVGWLKDLASALGYIHGKGVVHRDISLENVMIGPDGHAVIADFGIARILSGDLRERLDLTRYTMVEIGNTALRMGKAPYLAPELLRKLPAKAAPETDAWALGVLLFRLLTGFWFERDRRENSLEMLVGYEYDWQGLMARLLSEEPKSRLPEAGIAALPKYLKLSATPNRRWVWAVGAAMVVIGLGAAIWLWTRPTPMASAAPSVGKEPKKSALSSGVIGYNPDGEVTYTEPSKGKVIKVPDGVTTITEDNLKEWQGREVILPKSVHTLKIPKSE